MMTMMMMTMVMMTVVMMTMVKTMMMTTMKTMVMKTMVMLTMMMTVEFSGRRTLAPLFLQGEPFNTFFPIPPYDRVTLSHRSKARVCVRLAELCFTFLE